MSTAPSAPAPMLPTGAAAILACVYEATAPKPGNVHPGATFEDGTTYAHFIASAVVAGPILERAATRGVGQTVRDAVQATRDAAGTNTNLGTVLLLAPLAAVPRDHPLMDGICIVLDRLTPQDTRLVYQAVRASGAGGIGRTEQADVFADPPTDLTLVDAMRLAAEQDLVARQYVNGFADVFAGTAAWIADGVARGWALSTAIVHAHVRQIAACGDSLIARKCGAELAAEAKRMAAAVLAAGSPDEPAYEQALADFDRWLRADGHRRNPGTTADLVAAGLFVLLRDGQINCTKIMWTHN